MSNHKTPNGSQIEWDQWQHFHFTSKQIHKHNTTPETSVRMNSTVCSLFHLIQLRKVTRKLVVSGIFPGVVVCHTPIRHGNQGRFALIIGGLCIFVHTHVRGGEKLG